MVVVRELDVMPSRRALVWIGVLGLLGGPVFEQMVFGQTNAVTVAFLVLAWHAQRRGWQVQEGCWLGLAAALKLFPLVLLMIPLGGRRWRALASGLGTALLIGGLSVTLFGADIWKEFATKGMSEAVLWSDLWPNASLSGFWKKLYISQNLGIPLKQGSSLVGYWIGYGLSAAAVALATFWLIVVRGRPGKSDTSYALGIGAMLLLSPTCWPHYFLLLLIPFGVLWRDYRETTFHRRALVTCFVLLFLPSGLYLACCGRGWDELDYVVGPFITLTGLAVQTYALLGVWGLAVNRQVEELRLSRALARTDAAGMSHSSQAA